MHNEEWSLHSARVSEETNFLVLEIAHDGDLLRNVVASSQPDDVLEQRVWIFRGTDPVTIHKDLDVAA